jgi:hypothetical protein
MKIRRYLFLNILLLIIVFACSGIEKHSNSEAQRYYPEHASVSDNFENKLSHHNGKSEEDQIDQSCIILLPEQPGCQISGIYTLPLHNKLFVPVWQPPKIFRNQG